MMPKTSVNPAASRNSSRPNCRPFRHCSMKSVMMRRAPGKRTAAARTRYRRVGSPSRSLHRALVVKAILIVLDDGGDGLECVIAFLIFDRLLQIEILDREVIIPIFEIAAHRFE